MNTKLSVVHMTSVHPRDDTRIWLKMCRSLATAGYRVSLIVADGLGNEEKNGISIIDVGQSKGRLRRMTSAARRVYERAQSSDARICHFHDPELLPWGAALARHGKFVIYDAHEDVGEDVRTKEYIPAPLRYPTAMAIDVIERVFGRRLSAIVGATPVITAKFRRQKLRAVEVNNYPIAEELRLPGSLPMRQRPATFAYVGGIGVDRGVMQMVEAMHLLKTPADLNIAGTFAIERDQAMAEACAGWDRIRFLGQRSRIEVAEILGAARAGLVLFQPLPNNVSGRPNKLFEYMSAELPVIASDYPGWREIVDGAGCGLMVDPRDPQAIADAMQWILDHPDEAEAMGKRGRQAIHDRYSWDREAEKLVALYDDLAATQGQQAA